jgi:hypothetical protein
MVMSRHRLHILLAVILLCVGGEISYLVCTAGYKISVRNTGQENMRDVTVIVTGRCYSIGDIAPGSSRSRRVSPTGESSVEVEFTDEQGKCVRLAAGGYLEPGYRGQMDIEIQDGKIVVVKDKMRTVPY